MSDQNEEADKIGKHDEASVLKDLVYLLGHDVRNSVRALVEIPKWIDEDLEASAATLPGDVGAHIDLMAKQAVRLDRMINDLLAFSKIETPRTVEPLALEGVINDVIAKAQPPETFSISHDLQGAQMRIAEKDFATVLTELIINAIKHHHAETGMIEIMAQSSAHGCEMTVIDDGPGVPLAKLEQIFLPMKTMRPRDEVEGSGMGLSIARRIIESYGGQLTAIQREKGFGVRISIPAAKARLAALG